MKNQEVIVNHLKQYGFVFKSSEIYNGLANAWDYGPLGAILKNNIKNKWISHFITTKKSMFLLDSSIILNRSVWEASGHLQNFSDPLVDCRSCRNRFRADKIIEEYLDEIVSENSSNELLEEKLSNINCPNCKKKDWTKIRKFNLMFKTFQGVTEDSKDELFLRPETAQGIFINFKNIQRTTRAKLPFGVGQIGKSFRNEITPGNFIFRTREFEQLEIEYFFSSENDIEIFDNFVNSISVFLEDVCKIEKNNLRIKEHKKEELAHYSIKTIDFEFNFPHGFSELWGLAHRGNFDLNTHMEFSKKDLTYFDSETNEHLIPKVIEPSVGLERLLYALCCQHFHILDLENNEKREILSFPYWLSPYKVAVLPLVNKLTNKANEVFGFLLDNGIETTFDTSGSIGKRYRRQDAIGTYFCITIDFDTENDDSVTIRNRDTMKQERIKITEIPNFLKKYHNL